MKIYIIEIDKKFRPEKQPFKYPAHNKDYGVEQDFFDYLNNNPDIITTNPNEADWHYLPIFWTRWHLNNDYGKKRLDELQDECDKKILNNGKTFCICQYDDGPVINIGKTIQFLASRKSDVGIDIPLLSSSHKKPFFIPNKRYLASFIGRLSTNKIREDMSKLLSDRKDILIVDGNFSSSFFIKKTLQSFISLCPRGYGGSSFRLFEAMQFNVIPFLIGDLDTRPFKNFIKWDNISLYTNNLSDIEKILALKTKQELILMGKEANKIYNCELSYGKWCKYVLLELEKINNK